MNRPGLRPNEMQLIAAGLMGRPETRDLGFAWLRENAGPMAERFGAGAVGRLINLPASYCVAERASEIEAIFRPLVERYGRGGLALDRSVERVRNCAALRAQRAAELSAALR
jgi:hypothetical protein